MCHMPNYKAYSYNISIREDSRNSFETFGWAKFSFNIKITIH